MTLIKSSTVCVLHQIKWSLSKQELLFSDFCEDSDNIEEGAEYNKVLNLWIQMSPLKHYKTLVKRSVFHVSCTALPGLHS